jgi:hypothetical protein
MHAAPEQRELPLSLPSSALADILRKYEGLDPALVHLDEKETAVLTGQSPKTLESWRNRGQELRFLKLGRRVRYRLADVLAFLDRNTFTTTREAKARDRRAGRAQ